jgi:hypothetical protein
MQKPRLRQRQYPNPPKGGASPKAGNRHRPVRRKSPKKVRRGRHWSSREDCIRYYQAEGFVCGRSICRKCGYEQESARFPDSDPWKLECGMCGARASIFIEEPLTPPSSGA